MMAGLRAPNEYGTMSPMSNQAYRKTINELGMTIRGAARFFEINPKTSQRYANGTHDAPPPIKMLLALMIRMHVKPESVRKMAGLPLDDYSDMRMSDPGEEAP
jgi:hypothetical protein